MGGANWISTAINGAAAMLSSEVMLDWQQHLIQHVLKRPLCGLYGQAERVVMPGWCEHSHY